MGNATSCAPSITSSNGVVKVLSSDGSNLQVYRKPVKAGDLMLQDPRHFVCNCNTLRVGQRIVGLSADDDLEIRQFYFVLPMDLLYSVLTQEEFSTLSHKATNALKHAKSKSNFGRIFPGVLSEFCMFIPSESNRLVKTHNNCEEGDGVYRVEEKVGLKQQGSWRPALETITESPLCRI